MILLVNCKKELFIIILLVDFGDIGMYREKN
jgi:hypothetical protein